MIPVTKPFLPPKGEYEELLDGIWHREWLTNMGPLSSQLEMRLKEHLSVKHLLFVTNGTVAIQMAIKAYGLTGDIITTPFSFVATSSSIVWEGCRPVFVDIDRETFNIDATKIEAAITPSTTAILATHVYGNPCDIDAIANIAEKHGLKVIYDGAHAFGVNYGGKSVFTYGDVSVCSLHATKLYHSIEGGLVITQSPDLLKRLAYIRNFGFDGPEAFAELGINGKNSEFHAAMGLVNLKYITAIHAKRKQITEHYEHLLAGKGLTFPKWNEMGTKNYAYMPIVFPSEAVLLKVLKKLNGAQIFPRRYFYPSLATTLPYVTSQPMPVTDEIAKCVLCLPLYQDLTIEEVEMICRLIVRVLHNDIG